MSFPANLSDEERQAVAACVELQNQKGAARRLGVCRKTVNERMASAREKAGANTTAELMWMFIQAAIRNPNLIN